MRQLDKQKDLMASSCTVGTAVKKIIILKYWPQNLQQKELYLIVRQENSFSTY